MQNKSFIISLSFGNYLKSDGGVDKAIAAYTNKFNSIGISYVNISPIVSRPFNKYLIKHQLYTIVIDENYLGIFDEADTWSLIQKLKNERKFVAGIHIHHLLKFSNKFILDLTHHINAPVYFFIHDYYSICEQPNLMKNGTKFCGISEKPSKECSNCTYKDTLIIQRNKIIDIFNNTADITVVAPSQVALDIWRLTYDKYINNAKYCIMPHLEFEGENKLLPNFDTIKIGYIGRFENNKGKNEFIKLAKYIKDNNLNIKLYYFGFSNPNIDNVENHYAKVTPTNPDAMTNEIKNSGVNCAFLWSVWPETYSYTYYESFSNNLFILTNKNSGNIAQMVLHNNNGAVFDNIDDLLNHVYEIKKMIVEFKSNNIFGPKRLSTNNDILKLHNTGINDYTIKSECEHVNELIKIFIQKMYNNKNKLKIGDYNDRNSDISIRS